MARKKETLIISAALMAAALLYWTANPSEVHWLPVCPLHHITGLQCPFCGAQRMAHELLHLNLAAAFRHNAALLLSLPYWLALTALCLLAPQSAACRMLTSRTAVVTYLILLAAWMASRNIFSI